MVADSLSQRSISLVGTSLFYGVVVASIRLSHNTTKQIHSYKYQFVSKVIFFGSNDSLRHLCNIFVVFVCVSVPLCVNAIILHAHIYEIVSVTPIYVCLSNNTTQFYKPQGIAKNEDFFYKKK